MFGAMKSAAAAMFGVQSSDKHQQDFDASSPTPFILAGIIMVLGFLFLLAAVVKAVVS
jgi:hypothetical protein